MSRILLTITILMLAACGNSYEEEKAISKAEQAKRAKEDSLALKIGVAPTLDCLPIFIAKETALFDSTKADIRLKVFASNIDGNAALEKKKIEICVTDLVRVEHMKNRGTQLQYLAATNAYWQLIGSRTARIKRLKQLNDKMIGTTRFSAPALLADYATDSAKLMREKVFKIQVNDIMLRLQMLQNKEIDAVMLAEPYATTARLQKNTVMMDSREKDMRLGVVAVRTDAMKGERRQKQTEVFIKGYNAACDSINKNGFARYADILKKHYHIDDRTIKTLPKIKFEHAKAPREKDIATAQYMFK